MAHWQLPRTNCQLMSNKHFGEPSVVKPFDHILLDCRCFSFHPACESSCDPLWCKSADWVIFWFWLLAKLVMPSKNVWCSVTKLDRAYSLEHQKRVFITFLTHRKSYSLDWQRHMPCHASSILCASVLSFFLSFLSLRFRPTHSLKVHHTAAPLQVQNHRISSSRWTGVVKADASAHRQCLKWSLYI